MGKTFRKSAALYALVAAAALYFTAGVGAQTGAEHFDSRKAFASASRALTTIDFDSVSPARGFGMCRPEEGLTAGGVTFRARGGARFGPGRIHVLSAHYGAGNPMLNTGTLPALSWAAPNQPGNASLDVTLPAGTCAGCPTARASSTRSPTSPTSSATSSVTTSRRSAPRS